jgi:protein SCO1
MKGEFMQVKTMAQNKRLITIVFTALASALLGVWLSAKWSLWLQPPRIEQTLSIGTLIEPARALPAFSLLDHNESEFSNASLQGHWSVMFFGFTNCPGVCPTTLTMLKRLSHSLESLPNKLRPNIVFVSIDTKRDTPAAMKDYVLKFDPTFVGVTGKQSAVDAFTAALGVPSQIIPTTGDQYMVDHSQALVVTDPRGRLRAIFNAPHDATLLGSDYRRLVRVY